MRKQHANIDFSDVKQDEFSTFAHKISSALNQSSTIYPSLPITLVILNPLIVKWDNIMGLTDYPGKTGDLKSARLAVETALKQNAVYVNNIAKGDTAMLEKSGYPISKLNSPIGELLPPDSVIVRNGTAPTTFDINIAVVDKVKGYLFAYTQVSNTSNDPNLWTIRWSAKHTNTFGGFISGTQYKFAACAVGSANTVFWTNAPANLFAQ